MKRRAIIRKGLGRARLFQLKRIAKGLCPECPNPLPANQALCASCLTRKRQADRKRHNRQPWQEGKAGRPPKFPDVLSP